MKRIPASCNMSNSESTAAHKELDDLTECPICTEVFTDPRSLPCIHTYCLQCIVQWSKNGRPGDLISCPMCMKRFSIPSGGLESLPKNFFVERLKKTAELLRGSPSIVRNLCEACGVEGVDSTSDVEMRQRASIYCIDCHQRFCDMCGDLHRKINAARTHRTVRLDVVEPVDGNSGSAEVTSALRCQRLPELMCDQHLSECLKLFCENCEDVICIMCFVESHQTHKCSDVNQVVDSFKRRMVLDVVELERGITECRGWLSELEDRKHELAEAATKIESEIDERTEALKRLIEDKKTKLKKELEAIRNKKLAQIGDVVQMIDQRRLLMDGLRKYNEELSNKGAASDIARQTNALHNSTEEFLNFDDLRRQMNDLNASGLMFMSSNFSSLNNGVSIGKVQLQKTVEKPLLANSLTASTSTYFVVVSNETDAVGDPSPVTGVTSLSDEFFVLRRGCRYVDVYDATTFDHQRIQHVPDLVPDTSCDRGGGLLVASSLHECLFVGDPIGKMVHRVELDGSNHVSCWSVDGRIRGLHVNAAHNVLVTCCSPNKLVEFNSTGTVVKEIRLSSDIASPYHAVQLSNNQYFVSHGADARNVGFLLGDSLHRVCLVSGDGHVILGHGNRRGSGISRLNEPRQMTLDNNEFVAVADRGNNRLMVLSRGLDRPRDLSLSVNDVSKCGGLLEPCAIHFSPNRRRLYVGENSGGRVLVFEGVSEFK